MRLALSLPRADSYSISASDPFGRALWDLVVGPEVSFLVDHRRGRYCDLNSEVGVPQATLEEFSLRSLPSVLLGYLPVRPPEKIDEEADAIDFVDESDRRWTARIEAGRVVSWTLWLEGEPFVWWSRRQRGGILSHRRGSQLRWRQTLSEVLSDDYRPPPIPRGYESIVCDESDLPTWGAAGATAEGPEG